MSLKISVDMMLGGAGCCLAAASLSFGLYMNAYGPAASFGKSKDFTVFAQLAPHRVTADPATTWAAAAVATTANPDALDMTATASIPKTPPATPVAAARARPDNDILTEIMLEDVTRDAAVVSYDGEMRTVHVGDEIPGAGEVLEIVPGAHPLVRTSRGLIVTAQRD